MKTTVIQLEIHDDLVSIKDKMSWHTNPRMILVWPKRSQLLTKFLDLSLVYRAARSYGAELALVTHDPVVRENAQALNIPVFPSIPMAERKSWITPAVIKNETKVAKGFPVLFEARKKLKETKYNNETPVFLKIIAMIFSFFALSAMFFFIIPSAAITFHPQLTTQEVEGKIIASPAFSGFNPSGELPAFETNIEVSGELKRKSTGIVRVPTAKAAGSVTFTNLTQTQVTVPANSVLLIENVEGVKFITLEEVLLPVGLKSGSIAEVEALQPGEDGNIQKGEIISIAGELGALVSVTNTEDFEGGKSVDAPSPSEIDYTDLENKLLREMKEQAIAGLYESLADGKELIEESVSVAKIVVDQRMNAIDSPADEAILRMTVRFKALIFNTQDQKALALTILDGSLPSGFQTTGEFITINKIGSVSLDKNGQALWTVKVTRNIMPDWNPEEVANLLAGKRKLEAAQLLKNIFPQTEPAEIRLMFSGWEWMPFLPTQIHFTGVK